MGIQYNRDGTVLFTSDADPSVTQLEPAGLTQAQYNADYATFQATWPLAYWKAQRLADNLAFMQAWFNWSQWVDGGALTNLTGTQVANFQASGANNFRTKKASINAATTSAQAIAIDVTTGYPANP